MHKPTQQALESLDMNRLRQLVDAAGVSVADRRSRAELIAALGGVPLPDMAGTLTVPDLRAMCEALDLDTKGTKPALVARLLEVMGGGPTRKRASTPPPPAPAVPTRETGALKSALRQLSLEAAGGFRGKDAGPRFATALLECFGWPGGRPEGAEIPGTLRLAEHGKHTTREVTLLWKARHALLEVTDPDTNLDIAWKDLLAACLQMDAVPHYVVLTNQREVRLYDLGRDRNAPRLSTALDDLAKHSEAFPFLTETWHPGATPKVVSTDKVSKDVADLVARLYRSLKAQHPKREDDVIQFTLQCIITMFAEDIGLLPNKHFNGLLYEGAKNGDTEKRLRELFRQMSSKDVQRPPAVAYFNGGLFKDPVTLPLGDEQLRALTQAAEANWKYVDPHIFGSVFQGIMGDEERHATGAHYTAHEDIMRVVGPTIVEPWRKRIQAATTLSELLHLRTELFKFRVLDPACGSGNFLYVSFRELYALDTELLRRIREFPSAKDPLKSIAWTVGIPATNFYGIDTNRFAVELAKVTLNIAKKIAFEERKAKVASFTSQVEIDVEPSLPLDNLNDNIVCADALFTEWPEVEAIVGNPPFIAGTNIKGEIGPSYVARLRKEFPGAKGRADFCCYWFRRAHDRLAVGGRAGLVATSGVRVGNSREAALDYIVANGGTIVDAVSSRPWPGEASVDVSMVNWIRGHHDGPFQLEIGHQAYTVQRIETHLQLHADVSTTKAISANRPEPAEGVQFGNPAFRMPTAALGQSLSRSANIIKPVATADDLMRGRLPDAPDYCVDLRGADTERSAADHGGAAFKHLKEQLFPFIKAKAERAAKLGQPDHYTSWLSSWWKPRRGREDFFAAVESSARLLVCPKVSARASFCFLSMKFVPNDTLKLFHSSDDYSFGILQSRHHWWWTRAKGSRVRADIQYTNEVWTTFPWPQDAPMSTVAAVAAAGRELRAVRDRLMRENGWSLRALYQAAEVDGPHPLKDAQHALDEAVAEAYGMPPDQDVTEYLLELNQLLAEDEAQGRKVNGPGLPPALDPKDPRWFSTDCIEPPRFPKQDK